jgi:hypothetical protein
MSRVAVPALADVALPLTARCREAPIPWDQRFRAAGVASRVLGARAKQAA